MTSTECDNVVALPNYWALNFDVKRRQGTHIALETVLGYPLVTLVVSGAHFPLLVILSWLEETLENWSIIAPYISIQESYR